MASRLGEYIGVTFITRNFSGKPRGKRGVKLGWFTNYLKPKYTKRRVK